MNLSIVIPVYNCEEHLKDCLESIVNEIDRSTEILLIDDGSSDKSEEIYSHYDEKINIFKNKNQGVSYSRNFGIKKSSGKYIMFVDADDVLEKNWFNEVINEIKNSDFDICYFSKFIKNKNLNKEELIGQTIGVDSISNFSSACSKIYKKEIINKHNFKFNEEIVNGEDLLFNLEFILNSEKFIFKDFPLYKYRINYQSSTHSFKDSYFLSNKEFLKILKKILESKKINDELVSDYVNFSKFNSIYIALYRLSLINNKKIRKEKYIFLKDDIYKNIDFKSKILKNVSFVKKIIIFISSIGMYELSVVIVKLISNIKKVKKINNNIIMEEI